MLDADGLKVALQGAERSAGACSPTFCRVAGGIEGDAYLITHNGIGARTTDNQRVYATALLGLNADQLAAKLVPWIAGLHKDERINLNG